MRGECAVPGPALRKRVCGCRWRPVPLGGEGPVTSEQLCGGAFRTCQVLSHTPGSAQAEGLNQEEQAW